MGDRWGCDMETKPEKNSMEKFRTDPHTWINTIGVLLTIGTIVFFGGAMWSTVYHGHEPRISNLENKGSVALQEHKALDDERVANIKAGMSEIKQDLKEIKDKLDKLSAKP
jgi:hypothetical protein